MLIKMLRSQRTKFGFLRYGVAYRFDPKIPGHKDCAEKMLAARFAEKTTEKKLADAKKSAEAIAQPADAVETDAADGAGATSDADDDTGETSADS